MVTAENKINFLKDGLEKYPTILEQKPCEIEVMTKKITAILIPWKLDTQVIRTHEWQKLMRYKSNNWGNDRRKLICTYKFHRREKFYKLSDKEDVFLFDSIEKEAD